MKVFRLLPLLLLAALLSSPAPAARAAEQAAAKKGFPYLLEKVEARNGSHDYRGVSLTFAQEVAAEEIRKHLRFDPGIGRYSILPGVTAKEIVVRGSFRAGRAYRLLFVDPAAPRDAAPLLERAFVGPGPETVLAFASDRRTIERKGRELFPVRVNNVQRIEAALYAQPPLFAVDPARHADGSTVPVDLYRRARAFDASLATLKSAPEFAPFLPFLPADFYAGTTECREAFFLPPEAASDQTNAFHFGLPLTFRAAPERGALYLMALTGKTPAEDLPLAGMIQVTDLSIAYKRSPRSLLFWVTSLHEGKPAGNAQILLVRRDDARIAAGRADENGLLVLEEGAPLPVLARDGETFRVATEPLSVSQIVAAVAASEADVAYQSLAAQRLVHTKFPAREGTAEVDTLNAGLFTERGVYRPGEPVLFKGCTRAWRDGKSVPPAGQEYDLVASDPDGKEFFDERFTAGEFGGFSGTVETEGHFKLGQYALKVREVKAAGDTSEAKILATADFQVQEFERPRHYVTVTFRESASEGAGYVGVAAPERRLEATVKPLYYAGGPLKQAKVRWRVTLVPAVYRNPAFPNHLFGDNGEEEFLLESGETYTDAKGEALFSVPLEKNQFNGLFAVRVAATAVDIDGRAATGVETYKPAPAHAVGVAEHPANFNTGDVYTFQAVVLDAAGVPVPSGKLRAVVQRTDWFYALKRAESGEVTYSWDEYWVDQQEGEVAIENGVAKYRLTMGGSGAWRVRFLYGEGDAECASQVRFTVDWSGGDSYEDESGVTRQDIMKASQLVLFTSRRVASVGETLAMELHARRPMTHCLVAVERDEILSASVHAVNGRDFEFPLAVTERHRPNVFVSVIAVCPRLRFPVHAFQTDAEAPHAFFGVERIEVRDDGGGLAVEIEPSRQELSALPAQEVTMTLRAADRAGAPAKAEICVAVVDEAVLALTRYPTPSFAALARFLVPLSVQSGEGRFNLVSQDAFRLASVDPLTGGDGGGAYDSIPLRKDFRPVACFLPELRTNDSGEVTFTFTLPDSTTTYRVFAVACDKGGGFGAAERKLLVTKNFRLDPMLPRFFTLGDTFRFPLALFNRGAAEGRATFALSSDPALVLEPESLEATVPAAGRAEVAVSGRAAALSAEAKVTAKGTLGGDSDGIEAGKPVHAPWMRARRYLSGDLTGEGADGTRIAVDRLDEIANLPAESLAADPATANLTLSRSLWSRVAPGLAYLLEYPYGCVEQTSSRVIPLAGLRGLAKRGLIPSPTVAEIDERIKRGVERLFTMRAEGGGFAYWPGNPQADFHGTLYALTALTLAREAGYPVPADPFEPACKYVREQAAAQRLSGYHPFGMNGMAAFALALNGQLKPDEVDAFAGVYANLEPDARALHLLAQAKSNPGAAAQLRKKLIDANPAASVPKLEEHLRFRAAALWLMAARVLDAKAVADKLASFLIDALSRRGRLHSTTDTGLALLALADWLGARPAESDKPVKVTVAQASGEKTFELPAKGEIVVPVDVAAMAAAGGLSVAVEPAALVHWSLELSHPDLFEGTVPVERGIGLTKTVEPASGGSGPIRVGDIVKVTLYLTLPEGKERWRNYEYLAIEDPLPAGFEALNSALPAEEAPREDETRDENYYWRDGYYDFVPDHAEYRDDRVLVFRDSCWSGSFRFEYFARAICEGTFKLRPSKAHLMYDPDRHGIAPGGEVRIEPMAK